MATSGFLLTDHDPNTCGCNYDCCGGCHAEAGCRETAIGQVHDHTPEERPHEQRLAARTSLRGMAVPWRCVDACCGPFCISDLVSSQSGHGGDMQRYRVYRLDARPYPDLLAANTVLAITTIASTNIATVRA